MAVGNYQCNAANINESKPHFQLELSLAQFSPSLFDYLVQYTLVNMNCYALIYLLYGILR